jgi:hypothetical protein
MTKIFMPPLDSRWRFKADWEPPAAFINRHDNEKTIHGDDFSSFYQRFIKSDPNPGHSSPGYEAWNKRYDDTRKAEREARGLPKFEAGTVIIFDRYHVSHSGSHAITVRVLAAPDLLLTPKKQGGKMTGHGRLYFFLEELNTLPELELVTNLN